MAAPGRFRPDDWSRTISIEIRGFNPKIRRLSLTQQQELMNRGRQGVQAFLAP